MWVIVFFEGVVKEAKKIPWNGYFLFKILDTVSCRQSKVITLMVHEHLK